MRRFCLQAEPRRHSRVLEVRRWVGRGWIAHLRRLGNREKSREARRGWRDLAGGETASVCANVETCSRIVILAYLRKALADRWRKVFYQVAIEERSLAGLGLTGPGGD